MMAEERAHLVAGIEAEADIEADIGLAAGTSSEVGCTEPGIHRLGSSCCHLDRRKGFESGHRCSH